MKLIVRETRQPYNLYRRRTTKTRGGKPVYRYYYRLWDPDTQTFSNGKSTGQTNRAAAETWLTAELAKRQKIEKNALTLKDFAGIFDEGSDYLSWREQRGREMSWSHRRHCAAYLENYILPYFDDTRLADLRALEIEGFQNWLLKQKRGGNGATTLSPATCNHVTQALRLVTKWAIRQRVIEHDPFVGVESLAAKPKRRGIFTIDEVKKILTLGEQGWPDPAARVLNMLAAFCGLRKGELQAIRLKCIQPIELADGRAAAVILVDRSWERRGRLKAPKSGRARLVPVPPAVYSAILDVLAGSPWKELDHFLFYSVDPGKPMSHKKIDKDFARALKAAGISEEGRRERCLSFHSWRHWANSFLVNRGLPPLRVQQVIGHSSLKMTENYLHAGQDFSDVLAITGDFLKDRSSQ